MPILTGIIKQVFEKEAQFHIECDVEGKSQTLVVPVAKADGLLKTPYFAPDKSFEAATDGAGTLKALRIDGVLVYPKLNI